METQFQWADIVKNIVFTRMRNQNTLVEASGLKLFIDY